MAAAQEGHTRKNDKGYVFIKVVNHPYYGTGMRKRSHIVMSEKIGRRIAKGEDVHHDNEVKDDDSIGNLILMSHGEHSRHSRKTIPQWNKGKKQSPIVSAAISKANKNRVWSPEARQKLADARKRSSNQRNELGQYTNQPEK